MSLSTSLEYRSERRAFDEDGLLMEGVSFLLLALAMSVVGGFVLWFRSRRPNSVEAGVENFSREMRALAPRGRAAHDEGADAGTDASGVNVSDHTSIQED